MTLKIKLDKGFLQQGICKKVDSVLNRSSVIIL
ncbi:hypothetical protein BC670_2411 [Flavobacterium branchiophilum]|uniref:Uncharacterized protein n=1 Tax=Flavobacterium branchiophilum TaxID=55197 RepID=A0A543G5T4_9FLAO|nr:hypothetical protein BC670_2411 [Flavobacterium branchiophilum]